jgi:replicative DNA helicase Mcm
MEKKQTEEIILKITEAINEKVIVRKNDYFIIDWNDIVDFSTELADSFLDSPLEVTKLIKGIIKERYEKNRKLNFVNLPVEETISNIRVEHLNKIVRVKGMLASVTDVMPLVKEKKFECISCGSIFTTSGQEPRRCSCGAKNSFKVTKKFYDDVQEIVLEENQDEIGDRSPKRTRIRLMNELCDKSMNSTLQSGNKLEIIGVVQEVPIKIDNLTREELCRFRIFALQVKGLEDNIEDYIDEEDILTIEGISQDNPLEQLSESLAPGIIGNELIKKSLVLGIVGGVPKLDANNLTEKEFINIMLVGDASKGKSVLLKACHDKAPKSNYVTGDSKPSIAGLLGAVEKDELTGAFSLNAGVYPRSNGGLVLLDEADKIDEPVKASLHSVMESGIVTIKKAGIDATLQARCTTFFGANPENSRFDVSKTLVSQIKMQSTLLSRMDLIWVMRDTLDEEEDRKIIEAKFNKTKDTSNINSQLFRKYLRYCQKYKPKVLKEAQDLIGDFYLKIRKQAYNSSGMTGMPIVPRHLNALIRLSEASAKIRLSSKVEKEDAEIAIKLFEESLYKLGMDPEDKVFDLARISGGKTLSNKKKSELFLEELREQTKTGIEIDDLVFKMYLKGRGYDISDYHQIMEELNKNCLVICPKPYKWKPVLPKDLNSPK